MTLGGAVGLGSTVGEAVGRVVSTGSEGINASVSGSTVAVPWGCTQAASDKIIRKGRIRNFLLIVTSCS
jgi:hypothetical protein